jgi:hypothetical protein
MAINLFPRERYIWNVEHSEWLVLILIIVVPISLLLIIHFLLAQQSEEINRRISSYQEEITSYASTTQSLNNSSQHGSQNYLQATEQLLMMLSHVQEHAACVSVISGTKDKISLSGEVRSAADLSMLLKSWATSTLFASVMLESISQLSETRSATFRVHAVQSFHPTHFSR